MNNETLTREMVAGDCVEMAGAFTAQGWQKPVSQFRHYWQEVVEDKRVVLVAEYGGLFAGYLTILWISDYPLFNERGIPEIVDFNVLIKFQRLKIGTGLMDEAERRIAQKSPLAGLGVCLHLDYGAAQVLYTRRGYVPDGRGVYYQNHYPKFGEHVIINDDLYLYLVKRLR